MHNSLYCVPWFLCYQQFKKKTRLKKRRERKKGKKKKMRWTSVVIDSATTIIAIIVLFMSGAWYSQQNTAWNEITQQQYNASIVNNLTQIQTNMLRSQLVETMMMHPHNETVLQTGTFFWTMSNTNQDQRTAQVPCSYSWNKCPTTYGIGNAGTGYHVGEIVSVSNTNAVIRVTSVDSMTGGVTGIQVLYRGCTFTLLPSTSPTLSLNGTGFTASLIGPLVTPTDADNNAPIPSYPVVSPIQEANYTLLQVDFDGLSFQVVKIDGPSSPMRVMSPSTFVNIALTWFQPPIAPLSGFVNYQWELHLTPANLGQIQMPDDTNCWNTTSTYCYLAAHRVYNRFVEAALDRNALYFAYWSSPFVPFIGFYFHSNPQTYDYGINNAAFSLSNPWLLVIPTQ
jgi:hypothetical protein